MQQLQQLEALKWWYVSLFQIILYVLAIAITNNISLQFIDLIRREYSMVATNISVTDYAEFSHSRLITITPSSDEYMNVEATNLNDPNDIDSGNNNSSDCKCNVLLQQKFNTINKKLYN